MSTGGNVMYATSVEVVQVIGRVGREGDKIAPSNSSGKWTVARTAGVSTGGYTIQFAENYVEFLGAVISPESEFAVWQTSFQRSPRRLLVIFSDPEGTAPIDVLFSFIASFTENLSP